MSENLITKLRDAESEMEQPVFDSTNPHFNSRFASLKAVEACVMPPLRKHGILLMQSIGVTEDGGMKLTIIAGDGNESLTIAEFPLPPMTDMQKIGSAITYARRYSLSAAFNRVADDDDDGNAASSKPDPKRVTARIADLKAQAITAGVREDGINEWYASRFGDTPVNKLNKTQADAAIRYLTKIVKDAEEIR